MGIASVGRGNVKNIQKTIAIVWGGNLKLRRGYPPTPLPKGPENITEYLLESLFQYLHVVNKMKNIFVALIITHLHDSVVRRGTEYY